MLRKRLFAVFLLVAFIVGSLPMVTADEGRAAFDWESGITVASVSIDATADDLNPVKYKNNVNEVTVNVANTGEVYLTDIEVTVMVYWWNASSEWELNFTYDVNMTDYLDIAGNGDSAMDFGFTEGKWANGTDGMWKPKAAGKYQINASVAAMDVELGAVSDFMLADFEFGDSTDVGFIMPGDIHIMDDPDMQVWFSECVVDVETPLDVYNDTCILLNGNGTFGITVDLSSFGLTAPASDINVGVRVTDTSDWSWVTPAVDPGYPYWVNQTGAWDSHFWFNGDDDLYTFTPGTYTIEVNLTYKPDATDDVLINNMTNRTVCFTDQTPIDLAPELDLAFGGDYDKANMGFDYTVYNEGLADATSPTNYFVNISAKPKNNPGDMVEYAGMFPTDITGGAELVAGMTQMSTGNVWNPAATGTYIINITGGWIDGANEADDYDMNNHTSYEINIVALEKDIMVEIDTPMSGEYPHDYGLKVNTTVTNMGDFNTNAEGGDINVTLEMYEHGGAMVYSKVMTLGDHLAAGASNNTVIFNIPADDYEINANYDIMVWVNVTNATGHSQYGDEKVDADFINVTFYYPPNGTITGVVTGAPANMQVSVTNDVVTYYTETDATGTFAFATGLLNWESVWDVAFEGGYMYADDLEEDVPVTSGSATVVTLETSKFDMAMIMGTLTVEGDGGNLNVTREAVVKDQKDVQGESKATLEWNATTGVYDWELEAYKATIGAGDNITVVASVPGFAGFFEADTALVDIYKYVNETSNVTTGVELALVYDPGLAVTYTSMVDEYVTKDTNFKIVFDMSVDNTTINETTIVIDGPGVPDYAAVGNDSYFELSVNDTVVMLDLPGDLTEGETYTLTVTTDVLMAEGEKAFLPWDFEEEFETEMPGGTVTGTVFNENVGTETLFNVTVTLDTMVTYTDAFGEYIFEGVEAGTYDIMVEKTDWRQITGPDNVTVVAGETTDADFSMGFWPISGAFAMPATDFPVDGAIIIPFARAMNESTFALEDTASNVTGTVSLTYDDGTRATVATDGAITWADNGTEMTFTPAADLMEATAYSFWISGTVLDSHQAPLGWDIFFDFVTASGDVPPPRVLTADIVPIDGAVNQTIDVAVTITFNFPVDTTLTLAEAGITAVWATNHTWDNTSMVLTLVHDDFAYSTAYTVTVAAGLGAFNDTTVGALAADVTSTFTTIEDPGVVPPPTVAVTFGPFEAEEGTAVVLTLGDETYNGVIDANGMVTFDILASDLVGLDEYTIKVGDTTYDGDAADLTDGNTIGEDDLDEQKADKPKEDEDDNAMIYAVIGIVIVIIILLLVFASKGKKEEEEAPMDDEAGEAGEFECPSCGAMVSGDVGECSECGEVFEEDQFRCPECGAEVEPGMDECAECGETLEVPEKPEGEEGDEPMEGDLDEEPEGDDFDVESDEEEPMEAFEDEEDAGDDDDDFDDEDDDDDDDELDLDDDEDEEEE